MNVRRFRKKPVTVEAMQYKVGLNLGDCRRFVGDVSISSREPLVIRTLEGDMLVRHNDWIIKGVAGEFYPCKPRIFEATYEQDGQPT